MITFNADEVFEMAEQIERDGAKFYRVAAEFADQACGDLLEELAVMEEDHEKLFAAMRSELIEADKTITTIDPDNEIALYLDALADGEVFAVDPSEKITSEQSMADILKIAIGLEKDSIVFYHCIKMLVPKAAGKERIDEILTEEIGHIRQLSEQLAKIEN